MVILYWSFHSLEPRQDLCVSRPMLSMVTVTGSNCFNLKTPTGSTASFLISFSSGMGKIICMILNLSVPVFNIIV